MPVVTPVQRQLEAYNAGDIDAFMLNYSKNVKVWSFPDLQLLFEGSDTMRARYAPMFADFPDLHAEVTQRTQQGSVVIDTEYVTGRGEPFTAIAMYRVKNEVIEEIWFIK